MNTFFYFTVLPPQYT